jgi:ABC-type transport system substrate-binding protein
VDAPPEDAQRKRADELVVVFLRESAPAPEEAQRIADLTANFGSQDYATRENASTAILVFGRKALPALRRALASNDAEVARRALDAVTKIRELSLEAEPAVVQELRRLKGAAWVAINEKGRELLQNSTKAAEEALALEQDREVRQKRTEAAMLDEQADALAVLKSRLLPDNAFTKSNPGYVERAGKFYEQKYLPDAARQLAEHAGLTTEEKGVAQELLRKFIYDWLDAYVTDAGKMRPESMEAVLRATDDGFRKRLDAPKFKRYLAWRKNPTGANNALAFLFRTGAGTTSAVRK